MACSANCEAAFGAPYQDIRGFVEIAKPRVRENVVTEGIDIGATFPIPNHAASDAGRALVVQITALTHRNNSSDLYRFRAIVQVKKTGPQHEGFARNAMMVSFGALKDLDLVIVVDDDIDLNDPHEVEYAMAMRFDAGRDVVILPDARGHEMVRADRSDVCAKMGIDATVPHDQKEGYRRLRFEASALEPADFHDLTADVLDRIGF